MRVPRRARRLVLVVLLCAPAIALLGALPASGATCSGTTLCITADPTHDVAGARGDVVTLDLGFSVNGSQAATGATIDVSEPSGPTGLVLDSTTIRVDGTTQTTATAVPTANGFRLTLPQDVARGTDIGIDYRARIGASANADATVTATLTVDTPAGSASATTSALTVYLSRPDYQVLFGDLPAGRSPTAAQPVLGVDGYSVDISVFDNGADIDPGATFTASVTPGFTVDVQPPAIACSTSARTVTCRVPPRSSQRLTVDVHADPDRTYGDTGSLRVHVSPVDSPPDKTPADNTVTASLIYTGSALIKATITPSPSTIAVGASVTFTVTVTNEGPDPAEHTHVYLGSPSNDGAIALAVDGTKLHGRSNTYAPALDLGVGRSVRYTIKVTAVRAGVVEYVGTSIYSSYYHDLSPCRPEGCEVVAYAHFRTVATAPVTTAPVTTAPVTTAPVTTHAAPVTSTRSGPAPTTGSAAALPNTGTPITPELLGGLLLVAAGVVTTRVGRRRRH